MEKFSTMKSDNQVSNSFQKYILITGLAILCSISSTKSFASDTIGAYRQIFQFRKSPQYSISAFPDLKEKTWTTQSLLRLSHSRYMGEVRLKAEMEFSGLFDSQNPFSNRSNAWSGAKQSSTLTGWKTDSSLLKTPNTSIVSNLERLELSFSSGNFDFQVGRQPISLGTSHFTGVLDVISPFYPGYLDSSYKPGVDGIRIRTLKGDTGEMELILVTGKKSSDSTYLARIRDTYAEIDLELLAGKLRNRNFLGAGWEGERRRVNIWGEVAIFERKTDLEKILGGISDKYAISWIAGLEKDTGYDWRLGIAYLHQDFGARTPESLPIAYSGLSFKQGWTHLGASSYIMVSATREMNPLVNLNINGIYNCTDNSSMWQPTLSISTGDNSDLVFFIWMGHGRESEVKAPGIIQRSEFGDFPKGGGLVVRRFF